jgi:hypothetical protein
MNVRQKLSLAALCFTLPALAHAQTAPAPAAEPAAAPAAAPVAAPAPAPEPAKPAAPAMETKLYGFALLTYNMMDGSFAYPEYPGKVAAEDVKTNSVSARQSRFGFMVSNADAGILGAKVGGRLEADFFGSAATTSTSTSTSTSSTTCADGTGTCPAGVIYTTTTTTTTTTKSSTTPGSWDSALLRLRYAYGTAAWDFAKNGKLTLTIGQTDGLVNALHPELGAYIATPTFMFAGNLTRRSPQIRVGYDFDAGMVAVTLEAAALNSADKGGKDASILYTAGNNGNQPDVETHLAVVVKPGIPDVKANIGVGYHTNKQTYNLGAATEQSLTSTLLGIDAVIDLTKYAQLRGEWFTGKGSDEGQSGAFAATTGAAGSLKLLKTDGYWFQAVLKPIPQVWVVGGMGQEKADDAAKTTYKMVNVGLLAPVSKSLRFGLEYTSSKKDVNTATGDLSGSAIALSSRFTF